MSLEEKCTVSIMTHGIITLILVGVFRNIIQYRIIKGILKFLEKNKAMVIYEDPFPPIASINIDATDLRALLNFTKCQYKKGMDS